jgi:hypothetical protein
MDEGCSLNATVILLEAAALVKPDCGAKDAGDMRARRETARRKLCEDLSLPAQVFAELLVE